MAKKTKVSTEKEELEHPMPDRADQGEEFRAFHQTVWKIAANWVANDDAKHDRLTRQAIKISEALEGQDPYFASAAVCMWLDYHFESASTRGGMKPEDVVRILAPRVKPEAAW